MNRRIPELLRRWFGRPLARTGAPSFRPRLESLEDRLAPAMTFTVINNSDTGAGSLRQAIVSANANPGSTIAFNITATGFARLIAPNSPLPALTVPVNIDAFTEPGYSGAPLIVLDGGNAGANASGLVLVGGNSVVKGCPSFNSAASACCLSRAAATRPSRTTSALALPARPPSPMARAFSQFSQTAMSSSAPSFRATPRTASCSRIPAITRSS